MVNDGRGGRAQLFARRHQEFIRLWADGRHPLEIAQELGLSSAQLTTHVYRALENHSARNEPEYGCVWWKDLPSAIKRMWPTGNEDTVVKFEVKGDNMILSISPKARQFEEQQPNVEDESVTASCPVSRPEPGSHV